MKTFLAAKDGRTFLPDDHLRGHEVCFLAHDFLAELLRSAERHGAFRTKITFANDAEREAFHASADVFEWFETTGRLEERASFFRTTVFPALLSDFLHFVYEALESSRKGKLNVAYALLRKPLQENLFVLEVIASDLTAFSEHLANDPLQLRSQKAGGVDAHTRRIASVLKTIGAEDRFDAGYLAQLRYDKSAEDGFDGVCNKATHLITSHGAIQTEKLNINFIFSGWEAKRTQWNFLYSRLPYLLAYAHTLAEHVFGSILRSDGGYVAFAERRLAAATLVWAEQIPERYQHATIQTFVDATRASLESTCREAGRRLPTPRDLERMRVDGAWPGQSRLSVRLRNAGFEAGARVGALLSRL